MEQPRQESLGSPVPHVHHAAAGAGAGAGTNSPARAPGATVMRPVSNALSLNNDADGGPMPGSPAMRSDYVAPDTPSLSRRKQNEEEDTAAAIARIQSHKDSLMSNADEDRCLICMNTFTKKQPASRIPCSQHCNETPVHDKCVYEWKERQAGTGSCPLCRAPLLEMAYVPPDMLRSATFSCFAARKDFVTRPLPPDFKTVRCYLRVTRIGITGASTGYEIYLQAPSILTYPLGPLPRSDGPAPGDQLLLVARKRFVGLTRGQIDMTLDRHGKDYDRDGKNYVGSVLSNFSGLEHTIVIPVPNSSSVAPYSAGLGGSSSNLNVNASPGGGGASSSSAGSVHAGVGVAPSPKLGGGGSPSATAAAAAAAAAAGSGWAEIGCVTYSQNRFGRGVGPRKMRVAFPSVALDTDAAPDFKKEADWTFGDEYDEDGSEPKILRYRTKPRVPMDKSDAATAVLRRYVEMGGPSLTSRESMGGLIFGKNKEPYWLEQLMAYSLDFQGRVTLPSNKNFILLVPPIVAPGGVQQQPGASTASGSAGLPAPPPAPAPTTTTATTTTTTQQPQIDNDGWETLPPELMNGGDGGGGGGGGGAEAGIMCLQFGKVFEFPQEVYTMDVAWPLSILQAAGVVLSSADRKLMCA